MIKSGFSLALFCLLILVSSCDENRVYEKNEDIYMFEWDYNDKKTFEAEITDSKPKTVLVNFRHTYFFGARNVILDLTVKTPKDSIFEIPVNILLSEPNGRWYGECSGDICDIKFPIKKLTNYSFSDTGKYTFTLAQNMRVNPLPHAMGVGLRIENTINE